MTDNSSPPYLSLMLLSASALGYELLLMRLFSIIQWHHFAYLVIALALLGYGISGSLLYLRPAIVLRRFSQLYGLALLLFALSSISGFMLAQSISFNIEELFWNPAQILSLILIFLLLALPFAFAASAICMTFMHYPSDTISKLYAADLIGAGLGAIITLIAIYYVMPQNLLIGLSLTGVVATLIAIWETDIKPKTTLQLLTVAISALFFVIIPDLKLNYSPYKSLAQTLNIKGARIIDQRTSPLGHLTLVVNPQIPFRHAPGLSLLNTVEPLEQIGLFVDGDNLSAITRYPQRREELSYLDQTTSALAYHLKTPDKLLVIGSGTGSDLLQAHYHRVESIDALELNPQIIALVNQDYRSFAGPVYDNPFTQLHIKEARDYLLESQQQYDLIKLSLTEGASASSSGLYALNESYLYTREAMQLYLSRLRPEGILSITRWIKLPPRDSLKLFATAHQALQAMRLDNIEKRLLMIRNWQTSTLLIKNGLFTNRELEKTEQFCRTRLFDQAYHHQLKAEQSNRYNLLSEANFYRATRQIASGELENLIDNYKFELRPATDDRPYFNHFFKWQSFIEALKLRGSGGMPLIEWGYVVLLLSLGITGLLSGLLILLPLLLMPKNPSPSSSNQSGSVIGYFGAIGLAFLLIEIGTIQKFQLFLHHPIYAIAASLTAFLCFSGLGSYLSERLSQNQSYKQSTAKAILALCVIGLGYMLILPVLFDALTHLPVAIKIAITILLIAPMAICMGMPFPLAIAAMKRNRADQIPWAWGINGYASVISAGLSTVIAIQYGFKTVLLCAILLYLTTLMTFPGNAAEPD
ncbi:MAG: SAM-dependent methyltransferase [Candidatus Thiodiazotropha lotti]|nr:SAM-dependent methyltransferase [Candidatus Thiodiazotropha lotti]MCG8001455.1 SAM-dependent methyltransferase [Candidatus Thiodiazotropha lotti]MCW4181598.1 SAM-dependent methyltransferase [Candidatus Thiodiazotropha weberae]MCW4193229.1 SAM-dependent methyltransferase [Candidatus Thiodiazotropha weberae]